MKSIESQFIKMGIKVLADAPMAAYTTFRAGGRAAWLAFPENVEQLKSALSFLRETETPFFIMGNGSNLLVLDGGYPGVILCLDRLTHLSHEENQVRAEAGTKLSRLTSYCLDHGLTGLEFAGGIPGTVGGGVYMNAGAYGGELGDRLSTATILDETGQERTLKKEELKLSYRHSILMQRPWIVLEAVFILDRGDLEEARALYRDLAKRRRSKQPLELPSAGSTFKRPPGHFAGALIQEAGLQGHSIGGAQVSTKHAGFIVNTGGATATDILSLIRYVQKTVQERTGVALTPEVRFLGEE